MLRGDANDATVSWAGRTDITALGESLVIRVRGTNFKLFAYRV